MVSPMRIFRGQEFVHMCSSAAGVGEMMGFAPWCPCAAYLCVDLG